MLKFHSDKKEYKFEKRMRTFLYVFPILIVLFVCLSGCISTFIEEASNKNEQVSENQIEDYTSCSTAKDMDSLQFDEDGALYGTVLVSGTVVTILKDRFYVEGEYEAVYLFIPPDQLDEEQMKFFNYYSQMADDGNTINFHENESLFFKIGAIDGWQLESSASISSETARALYNSYELDEQVFLKLAISIPLGKGANESTSFACDIAVKVES
jgi:hypothetical protein